MTIKATICHIIDGDRILLLRKSAGLFGEGKWNGVGGKLRESESPREGAAREALEESGLRVGLLKDHGVLRFYFGRKQEPDWIVHVFSTRMFEGETMPGEEGTLRWFKIDEIPYDEMWQDDEHWLPLLLEGRSFDGEFIFNEDGTRLLEFNLNQMED